MRKTHTIGRQTWHELFSPDPETAVAFYRELLGWKTTALDMGPGGTYNLFWHGEPPAKAIHPSPSGEMVGGAMPIQAAKGLPGYWNHYFTVPNVEASLSQVVKSGGKAVSGPNDIPNIGRFATVTDPQGSHFSIVTLTEIGEKPEDAPMPGTGQFCWIELQSDDPKGVMEFYRAVFGWTFKEYSKKGEPPYYEITGADGVRAGGLSQKSQPGPNAWLSYVGVEDVDRAVKRALTLKGKVITPATDIPTIGRFAVIQDPTGATNAVFKSFPTQKG